MTNPEWNWEWEIDGRAAPYDTENRLRVRNFSEKSPAEIIPEALEAGCRGEFLSMSLSGRRLYLSGWEALESRNGDGGRISYIRPKHGMGFLIRHGNDMAYYPTMPLSVVLENAGQNENINYGFDDYLLVRESWLGGKITIYPAFLSGNYKVFYRGCGKSVALPRDPAGSGVE